MASIIKRGSKFLARTRIQGRDISRTFPTRQAAQRWVLRAEASVLEGTWEDKAASATKLPRLREALERYESEVTPLKRGAEQERLVIGMLKREARLVDLTLGSITPPEIAAYRDRCLGAGLANATVRIRLALISAVFTHAALEWGYSSLNNPVSKVQRPAPGQGRERRITDAEFQAVLACVQLPGLANFAALALETAARRGELCKLQREDVDLSRRLARLRETKNGKDRLIPLTKRAHRTLERIMDESTIEGPLFDLSPMAVSQGWRRAVQGARKRYEAQCQAQATTPKRSWLADLHFHDLRHEATSRLFDAGLSPIEVASVTGHSGAAMLARYAHADPQRLAQKLAALV